MATRYAKLAQRLSIEIYFTLIPCFFHENFVSLPKKKDYLNDKHNEKSNQHHKRTISHWPIFAHYLFSSVLRRRAESSQAIECDNTVYVSGQIPVNPATGQFAEGGIKDLARQSLTNISNILAEAGLTMDNVVKVTVLLADISDFAAVNEVYAEFFSAPYPARSAFAVAALPKGAKIEIEAIAVR